MFKPTKGALILRNKQWDNGKGLMISEFQLREFGRFEMTPQQLEDVNRKRSNEHYVDTNAAVDVRGSTKKEPITESPFVTKFEYGANKDGYWTSNHTILRVEDCTDCLKVVLGDKFDFYFQFDNSIGHASKQQFGLDAASMTKGYGGVLQHSTKIEEATGYLGPFYHVNDPAVAKTQQGARGATQELTFRFVYITIYFI